MVLEDQANLVIVRMTASENSAIKGLGGLFPLPLFPFSIPFCHLL